MLQGKFEIGKPQYSFRVKFQLSVAPIYVNSWSDLAKAEI